MSHRGRKWVGDLWAEPVIHVYRCVVHSASAAMSSSEGDRGSVKDSKNSEGREVVASSGKQLLNHHAYKPCPKQAIPDWSVWLARSRNYRPREYS